MKNRNALILLSAWILPHSILAVAPLPLQQAVDSIQVEPGLRLDLVAQEPMVIDPVALAWDEKGRLFVAENRGYPEGPVEGTQPAGTIARLEDRDGDGIYDHRTIFAEGLTFPNGVLCWKEGLIVTSAPDVFYFRDLDDDGRADQQETWLTGFSTASTTQLRVSHPTLGPDGWIHLTAGLQGGEVFSPKFPDRSPMKFSKSDSRFHPESLVFQTRTGQAQFGLSFDAYGNKFICANRNPAWHVVWEQEEFSRQPGLRNVRTIQEVGTAGAEAVVYPRSKDTTTASFMPRLMNQPHAGSFTSACGIHVFQGGAMPSSMNGNLFVCEPAQNLVQRRRLLPSGATFDAHHEPGENRECLASTDPWFRPVFTTTGPDGALYICDMYRRTLDHPRYLPENIREKADFVSGRSHGRIYRLARQELPPGMSSTSPQLSKPQDWVQALNSPNGWTRETAVRLCTQEAGHADLIPLLNKAWQEASSAEAAAAILRCLHASQGWNSNLWKEACDHTQAGVRRLALRLLASAKASGALEKLPWSLLLKDPDPGVRAEVAMLSHFLPRDGKLESLIRLAGAGVEPAMLGEAWLSATQGLEPELWTGVWPAGPTPFWRQFGEVLGSQASQESQEQALTSLLNVGDGPNIRQRRAAALLGLWTSSKFLKASSPQSVDSPRIREILEDCRKAVGAAKRGTPLEADQVAFLARAGTVEDLHVAAEAILESPTETALILMNGLRQARRYDVLAPLLQNPRLASQPSPILASLGSALLAETSGTLALLQAVQAGHIPAWTIDSNQRTRLLTRSPANIKALAEKVLQSFVGGDRMKVYESHQDVLTMTGRKAQGRKLFEQSCANCHRFGELGAQVGPDLTGVSSQPPDALLLHILVPNYEVYPGFTAYNVDLKDGESVSGLLISESKEYITLRQALGFERTLDRQQIQSLRVSPLSLMPDGMEAVLGKQGLADVIAFIKANSGESLVTK